MATFGFGTEENQIHTGTQVNLDRFLGLAGSVRACRNCCTETNLGSDWSVMLLGCGPTIQIYIAGNGALHSCGWRVT